MTEPRPNSPFTQIETSLSVARAQKEMVTDRLLVMRVPPEKLLESLRASQNLGITHLSTITGVDAGDKIDLNYHFSHLNKIITIKTSVPKNKPEIETVTSVIPGAVLYEMEVHDMFGVNFQGNPWMDRKLLLPDNYPDDLPPPLLKSTSPEKIRKAVGVEK